MIDTTTQYDNNESKNFPSKNPKAVKILSGAFNIYHAEEGFLVNENLLFVVYDCCGYIKKSVIDKMMSVSANHKILQRDLKTDLPNQVKLKKHDPSQRPFITYQAFQELKKQKKIVRYTMQQ